MPEPNQDQAKVIVIPFWCTLNKHYICIIIDRPIMNRSAWLGMQIAISMFIYTFEKCNILVLLVSTLKGVNKHWNGQFCILNLTCVTWAIVITFVEKFKSSYCIVISTKLTWIDEFFEQLINSISSHLLWRGWMLLKSEIIYLDRPCMYYV